MRSFPNFIQPDYKDCGATCLKIIANHYGANFSVSKLREYTETTREGTSLLKLSTAAEKIGFRTLPAKITLEDLKDANLPCLLYWNSNHYVVLYKIRKDKFYVSDPAHGLIEYNQKDFLRCWIGNTYKSNSEGIVLLLEVSPDFFKLKRENTDSLGLKFLLKYILRYKKLLWQLILGLFATSIIQFIFPFLTQSIVDVGIRNQDINFIYLILFAQLSLFAGKAGVEIIRGWILLHLSTKISISLVSDFFVKLMNLKISFFDTRMTGDLLQRINDHKRIEALLTTSSINAIFSIINLLVFSIILAYYNLSIFSIFISGSILYVCWIVVFLKKRADIDYKHFSEASQEQSKVIELINGMQEIKLHNAEKRKRWSWEYIQARLFKVSIRGLALEQYQSVGSRFINELKNLLITALSASLVIDGHITLGMMLSISYIVGQLNSPISSLINFIREVQDAKISINRLSEIHKKEDEVSIHKEKINLVNECLSFRIENVSFRYVGSSNMVLENLNLNIPSNKITAIVGSSGSGKTTLLKLLLNFYQPNSGIIKLGNNNLDNISPKAWRSTCGVVMQEGYIFNDTIINNIALGHDIIDKEKLEHAINVANISSFIKSLPMAYNTKIGNEGVGLSTGQKQRLLIARAIYKKPRYLFFDEATSSLDTNNEKVIMENLNMFFENKTVVIIAHRLSTVKNAHQIVVLDKGRIVEVGNHENLVKKKGNYYNLVKNQLELGK